MHVCPCVILKWYWAHLHTFWGVISYFLTYFDVLSGTFGSGIWNIWELYKLYWTIPTHFEVLFGTFRGTWNCYLANLDIVGSVLRVFPNLEVLVGTFGQFRKLKSEGSPSNAGAGEYQLLFPVFTSKLVSIQ